MNYQFILSGTQINIVFLMNTIVGLARFLYRDNKIEFMTAQEIDRIIEMAWEDRTPFEAIEAQFGISESKVIRLMRGELKRSSFDLWRKRVNSGVSQKHLFKRDAAINRFKSKMQRSVSMNAISKR